LSDVIVTNLGYGFMCRVIYITELSHIKINKMKTQEIVKIVLSEEDILNAINNELLKKGLKPNREISIRIGTRTTGYGMGERDETYIADTIIECTKVVL